MGVTFCCQKVTKDPPKEGPSPSLWNPPRWYEAVLASGRSSALGPVGSHRWHGNSMGGTCSSAGVCFYPQGLTLVKQLFPAADGLAPGGGNALSDSFPHFSSWRNGAQRSVLTRLASLNKGRIEGQALFPRREGKRAVAGTACNSPPKSVLTGTAWTQTAPRRCGQWPRQTYEPQRDT